MKNYEHIIKMEAVLDKHSEIIKNFNRLLDEFEKSQEDYQKLKDYYLSDQINEDLDRLNKEEFPKDLKCGVLSEDEVFNLIGDNYQTAIHMLEVATKIIKNH
ncbi:MAG: DUF4298 domain-containing protein [Peptoniphilaceae bacterium]|nr:DUF4298 domain-containing protein [Peptoniphilaceae bacterium]MDY6018940.1 DUF4298 domain-containing protein [Anaerococcus sp.]